MAAICSVTGKGPLAGNNVSHSKRRTKTRNMPNLQNKTLVNPATGKKMKVKISTSALRTLQKWDAQGKAYDLRELMKEHQK